MHMKKYSLLPHIPDRVDRFEIRKNINHTHSNNNNKKKEKKSQQSFLHLSGEIRHFASQWENHHPRVLPHFLATVQFSVKGAGQLN